MKNAQNIKVFLFKEYSFSLQVLVHNLFLLFNRFRLTINLLKDYSHKVHLASCEGLHFFNTFLKRTFIDGGLQTLYNSFVI